MKIYQPVVMEWNVRADTGSLRPTHKEEEQGGGVAGASTK